MLSTYFILFFFFCRKEKGLLNFVRGRIKLVYRINNTRGTLPSFLQFYFRVRAFSIQRAQLSRSMEQARPLAMPCMFNRCQDLINF